MKKELVKSYTKKDFDTIYSRHYWPIWGFCNKRIAKDDVDDVVQEVFFSCYKYIDKFENRSKLSTWIFEIAKSKCSTFYQYKNTKSRKGEEISFDEIGYEIPYYDTYEDHRIEKIKLLIDKEDDRTREIMEMRFYKDMQNIEIAKVFNIKHKLVDQIIHRSLARIKARLIR